MNDTLYKQFRQWWKQIRCFHCYWGGKTDPPVCWNEYSKTNCVNCGKLYDQKCKRQYFIWIPETSTVDFSKPYEQN